MDRERRDSVLRQLAELSDTLHEDAIGMLPGPMHFVSLGGKIRMFVQHHGDVLLVGMFGVCGIPQTVFNVEIFFALLDHHPDDLLNEMLDRLGFNEGSACPVIFAATTEA